MYGCFVIVCTAEGFFFFFASNLSFLGCSHVDLLFADEEEEKVGSVYVNATHAKHVHGITDFVKVAVPIATFLQLSNTDS